MKRIIITLVSVLIVIVSFNIFTKPKNETNKIVVSEVTHSVFYAPWYVALENKYFEDNGLNIEVVLTPGADKVATSVISGDANIGFSGPEATIYVYNNSKQKLKTFASLTKRDGQFLVGDCIYKDNFKMEDLKGKKVLAGRSGGMPLLMFKYALKESGIKEEDVIIDTSVEFAGLTGAFISKQGDFVNLFEPNATKVENENYGCVLESLGKKTGVVPYTTFYADEKYIDNHKKELQNFNKALNKGLKFVKDNDEVTIAKSIINQFPDTSIKELSSLVKRYKDAEVWYDSTMVNINDYNRLIDIMIYGKSIDKKPPIELLITNEFNK